jgi:hypothetical protein
VVDTSPDSQLVVPFDLLAFEPGYCAPATPGLDLTLSFRPYRHERVLVVSLVPSTPVFDARVVIITLAGAGLTFSSNRNLNFISPIGIAGSAFLNISTLVIRVSITPSWNFPQYQPIVFEFGNLESAQSMVQYDLQSAMFSTNGTCLLQSNSGLCPSFTLFPPNLPMRYMLQCPSSEIDHKGFC